MGLNVTKIMGIGLVGISLTAMAAESVKVDQERYEKARVLAKDTASLLYNALHGKMRAALEAGGPTNGIEVCSSGIAQEVAASVQETDDTVVDVRRTSMKYRNPLNRPDSHDVEVLGTYQAKFDNDQPWLDPSVKTITEDGQDYLLYYSPIRLKKACLNCHGSLGDLHPKVRETLEAKYPEDRATGYKVGDFRGVVRIKVEL